MHQSPARGTPLILDAYAEFMAAREAANVTQGTLDFYHRKLRPFCVWCSEAGLPHAGAVRATHIREYLLALKRRKLSPWTLHGAARAIKAFLRFCCAERMIGEVPAITMPRLPKELPQPFTPAEVGRLLDGCECERDQALLLFLLDTGLRAAEVVALDGGDVDLATGTVFVRSGKGRKDRVVYIGARTKQALLRGWRATGRPAATAPLWVTRTAPYERLSLWGLCSLLRRLGKRAEVTGVAPHRFRRTFAVWSLRAGMDVFTLQRLMGHADLATTRRYVALVDDDLRASHKRFGAVDGMLLRR
jgi:site-specific recombinase XerD